MGVVQVETFDIDVNAASQTYNLTNDVGSTTSAFVRNTNPRAHSGGPVGNTSNADPNDMSGFAYLSATNQLTLGRLLGTVKMAGEVWRYSGAPGGLDEFIVRSQHQITLTSAGPSTAVALNNLVDRNKCIAFITGKTCTQTSRNASAELGAIAYINENDELIVERGTGTTTLVVYVTVVEFTVANWSVAYSKPPSLASTSRTLYLDSRGNTGATATIDWGAAIFAEVRQSGGNGSNDAIEDLSFTCEPNTASTYIQTKDSTAANTGAGFVYVLQNAGMTVARATQSLSIPNNNSYRAEPFPTGLSLTNLNEACIEWTVFSDGTGTAHGRGALNARLTGLDTIQSWVHRSGNTGTYRYGVADLTGIQGTTPLSITSAPTQLDVGDTDLTITGSNFKAVQGSGSVVISDTPVVGDGVEVTQSIDSWSDTSIQFDADLTGLSDGVVYIIVINSDGASKAASANKGVLDYTSVINNLTNAPDHFHTFNNTYADSAGSLSANSQNSTGTQGFFADPLTRGRTHSWGVTGNASRIEMTDSPFTNISNTHRRRFICGWFRFPFVPLDPKGIWEEGGNVNNIYMVIGFGGKLLCNVADSSNGFKLQAFSSFLLNPNRIYHIALLFDGDLGCRCWIDGVEQPKFDGAAPNSDQATHSGDYAYGQPDGSLDTGGTDIQYPSFDGSRYNDWMTFSEAGNDIPSANDIRVEIFEKGAREDIEILSDTPANMQLAIDALSGNSYPDSTMAIKINKPVGVSDLDLNFDNISFGDRTSIQVQWMGSNGATLSITNRNGSNLDQAKTSAPYGGTVSVINPAQLSLTGLQNNTEVLVLEAGTETVVANEENVTTGTFSATIEVASVDIMIVALGYQVIRLEGVTTTSDTTLPIQQRIDRQYENN